MFENGTTIQVPYDGVMVEVNVHVRPNGDVVLLKCIGDPDDIQANACINKLIEQIHSPDDLPSELGCSSWKPDELEEALKFDVVFTKLC